MGKNRDGFKSRTGFVLACIGSAVGMGNIWRFPYMVSDWGGMTFLLPYVLFVVLIASTGVIEEMALGRAAKMQSVISEELKWQLEEKIGRDYPDYLIACVVLIGIGQTLVQRVLQLGIILLGTAQLLLRSSKASLSSSQLLLRLI